MRPEQRKKLDRTLRRQKLKTLALASTMLAPALLFLAWWFDPPIPSGTATGTMVALRQAQSVRPGPPFFVVEIDSGGTTAVGGTAHLLFEPGRKVVLQRYEGQFFGKPSFRFLRYADE